ncbi:exonuclease domain-containing protein [Nocardia sp. NPDC058176]|uniref:3'-5' exonuclease n=1 Tax=Nocardia sp. NPDC058176 TaxID=3346368 RepID=UPI0036DA08D8
MTGTETTHAPAAKTRPLGVTRCAQRLAERLGLAVEGDDIAELARTGHLQVADRWTKCGVTYDLFDLDDIDALDGALVAATITARADWLAISTPFVDAAEQLGWRRDDLGQVLRERGIERGRFGRIPTALVAEFAADTELAERMRLDRVVTADHAATEILDVPRRHFDIAVEAGWVTAQRHHVKEVGRYRTVSVPLYRTGDIEALLDLPDVDWAAVRECGKGERSPLLDIVGGRKASRAKVIRSFLRWFGAEHGIEMWGWWMPGPDVWEIDWERIEGGPTKADVAAAIAANPALAQHRGEIELHSAAGAAIRFARAMLAPGAAVILDTETTDLYGRICEIAIVDACTGKTLLDTLVNPGVPITGEASAIHGLSDADVTAEGVPDWKKVYPRVLRATKGRTILAYNAPYDRTVVAADCMVAGIARSRLTDPKLWADVMVPRAEHARSPRWLPNGGGHRALGDTQETRRHLQRMTAP